MNQAILDFMAGKRVAVLGASRSGKKFGNTIASALKERGYQVAIVHPQAEAALRDAAAAGIQNIWLQQGAESSDTPALAQSLGLNAVSGRCILMYAEPVRSFHRWHRAFARLTGNY